MVYFIRNIVKWPFSKDSVHHSTLSTFPVKADSLAITTFLLCLQSGSTRCSTIYVITPVFLLAINKEVDRNGFLRLSETETII